jgi:hypothetical protein
MNEKITSEMISRRRAFSLLGMATAFAIEPFVKVRFAIADEMIE